MDSDNLPNMDRITPDESLLTVEGSALTDCRFIFGSDGVDCIYDSLSFFVPVLLIFLVDSLALADLVTFFCCLKLFSVRMAL